MKKLIVSSALAFIIFSTQAAASQVTDNEIRTGEQLTTSHVFSGFGCEGGNTPPSLTWSGAPEGTKSFVATVYDPGVPTGGGWWHQTVANIPVTITYLPTDTGRRDGTKLPAGAAQGRNDLGYAGSGGACPPKGGKPHYYQFKVWALKTDRIPVDSNSSGASAGYMLNANKTATAEMTPAYEMKQGKGILAKDKSNLKIEKIRTYRHHEIHRAKPLMSALRRIRQGKKAINRETHSLTAGNNQITLFPCGYELYIANYPEVGSYLAEMLYHPTDLIEKFQKFYAITDQVRSTTGFRLSQNPELIYCREQLETSILRGFSM